METKMQGCTPEECKECDQLRATMAGLLTDTANVLKGEPKPLHQHSWHDLPDVAKRMRRAAAGPGYTPNAMLPPLGDGPRRKLLVTIEVPANWEDRLDMQWVVEREIHSDRWSWSWAPDSTPNAGIKPRRDAASA